MYTFIVRSSLLEDLKKATQTSQSIISRLEEMENNPLYKAKKTEIPAIGEFYVNAGRYCILFDADMDNEKIEIRTIISSNLLHKLIKWKIPVPDRLLAEFETGRQ